MPPQQRDAMTEVEPKPRGISPEAAEGLRTFAALLERWNTSINLVSRGDLPHLWLRHIEDSLQLGTLPGLLPPRVIDLGSGAGFPGLVLSIAYGVPVDLIEQDRRKCAFLREAVRVTGAPATVHAVGIEQAVLQPAPVITARALARVARLLDYAERLLTPDGECWFLKTQGVEAELAEAERHWRMRVTRLPSRTAAGGVILRLSEISRR
jgi:16S rRNA (guanine527-N7)-methyltransferase